jgi:hypothetical protein
MIVWQGSGFLVAVVGIAVLALTEYVVRIITKDEFYYPSHGWPKLVGFWLAAAAIYGIARYFDSRPGKVVIEKDTGKEIVLRTPHSLFFVPMKYWTYVFLVLVSYFFSSMPKKKQPNQALEPTLTAVTNRADARSAPAVSVAHL